MWSSICRVGRTTVHVNKSWARLTTVFCPNELRRQSQVALCSAKKLQSVILNSPPDSFAPHAAKILALIDSGQLKESERRITVALAEQPTSPSARFALAKLHAAAAQLPASNAILLALIDELGERYAFLALLASNQARLGDSQAAYRSLCQAEEAAESAQEFVDVSIEADRQGQSEIALRAIERALRLKPQLDLAHLQRARVLQSTGAIAEAEIIYRSLIAKNRLRARAWFALMDLKTSRLSAQELQQLSAHYQITQAPEEKMLLAFALGKALEDAGQYPQAFARLIEANRMAQRQNPWNAQAFARAIDVALTATATKSLAKQTGGRGHNLLFLVGLPRSGTTLVEQVLAAHPNVCGAGELPHLPQLIADESTRRGTTYPFWLSELSDHDAERLGEEYLRLTARWRTTHRISTDKLPENWQHIGLISRILPGARIIDCLRDPTETAWSCYKQLFAPGRVPFSYRFEDLGAFWRNYRSAMLGWAQAGLSDRIYNQSYEKLITDTEAQVSALLDFCDLEFDARCLSPHLAKRDVHTPSAAQVRQPMRAASMKTPGYGELMQALRQQFIQDS